ncbi:hypothetical protein [Lentzea cavernae]|nr:hypothetical protein [Lentzea cavernae]
MIAGNGSELDHLQAITRHDDRILSTHRVEGEEKTVADERLRRLPAPDQA